MEFPNEILAFVFVLLLLSLQEFAEVALLVGEEFEVEGFDAADEFDLGLELVGDLLLLLTEDTDEVDDLIQDDSTETLYLAIHELTLVLLAEGDEEVDCLETDDEVLLLDCLEGTDVLEEEFEGEDATALILDEVVQDALALDGPVDGRVVEGLRSLVDSQNHRDHMGHFIGGPVELPGCLIGIKQTNKPFRTLQKFEVVLDGDHEQLVDVDVDQLHGGQQFEGSIEDPIDEDEQFGADEDPNLLGGVIELAADELEQRHLSADLR